MTATGLKVAFVTVLVMLIGASPALAERSGSYWPATAWTTYGQPHGGYTDTSGKCKVCHAVHGAGLNATDAAVAPASQVLLRTTVADACLFCHVTGGYATTVYGGVLGNYQKTGSGPRPVGTSAHVDRHQNTPYQGCASCHSVHGANIIPGSKILKDDPAKGVVSAIPVTYGGSTGYGSFAEPVTNQRDFCQDCHNGTKRYGPGGITATIDNQTELHTVFPECNSALCHSSIAADGEDFNGDPLAAVNQQTVQFGVDATSEHDGRSHIMAALPDYTATGDQQLAWSGTAYAAEGPTAAENSCTTCHTAAGFPHMSNNVSFIEGYAASGQIDGVCARCHTDTGSFSNNSAGVGSSY